ncbi:expressed unknown protein [Seminavis robusta]|uniref:Uncharacterized protein n=1 Tax=Seminavis robusta TaxID=568900 RepID=A0A9N8H9J4_9STRA|nr:expressed unknown protein [Seminavis robusta]|eukprot:Sro278_g106540.1 n/a (373) ;mRNA; f:30122-31240
MGQEHHHHHHDVLSSEVTAVVSASLFGMIGFLSVVVPIALWNFKFLFWSTHGWSHRAAGGCLLLWLCVGVLQAFQLHLYGNNARSPQQECLIYDTILGILGITTTLTAARDFPHKYVQNAKGQSGSLSQKALVTQGEMVEHSFYQCLNLLQAWYLHFLSSPQSTNANIKAWEPFLALWLVTSPWYLRKLFPINSFSHNWKFTPQHQRTPQETILYRIKKSQYMFYKHVLLHGLNISMALQQSTAVMQEYNHDNRMTATPAWRVYWLALNTSYVMEFFLQTLVRRNVIHNPTMLRLQQWLMTTSSIAAMWILAGRYYYYYGSSSQDDETMSMIHVRPLVCLMSLVLNLVHRHHDVFNVMITAGVFYYWQQQLQ